MSLLKIFERPEYGTQFFLHGNVGWVELGYGVFHLFDNGFCIGVFFSVYIGDTNVSWRVKIEDIYTQNNGYTSSDTSNCF